MNLHRANKQSEWAGVSEAERNCWQLIAAKTSGIVTPGNAVTIGGFGLVLSGLRDMRNGDKKLGFAKIAAGRIADLVDGAVAHRTGTKSSIGEGLDAATDKVAMLLALPVLASTGELPRSAAATLAVRDVAFASISALAKQRGRELHPSAAGKRATFEQWLALSLYASSAMAAEAGHPTTAQSLYHLGHIAFGVMAVESTTAFNDYAQQAFRAEIAPVVADTINPND